MKGDSTVKKILGLMVKTWCMLLMLMLCMLHGAALASGEDYGYTTRNFPEDFTDGKYQPQNSIATFSLDRSKTVDQAIADGDIPKASKNRLEGYRTTGLDADITYADGLITIHVDMANSDWQTVLINANPYPYVSVRHSLDRPSEDYETHTGFSGGFGDETLDYVLGLMDDGIHWDSGNTQSSNGIFVGEIVPAQSLLLPTESGTEMNLICWLDKDDPSVRYYEYYEVKYVLSSSEPLHIPFRYVTEAMLEPTRSASLPDGVEIKSITDGDITFRVDSGVNNVQLPIVLSAPEGAARMTITQPEHRKEEVYTVSSGKVSFNVDLNNGQATNEEQYTIAWYDADGALVEYGIFMYHTEPKDYAAWPYYESDWHAPDADRMTLINECEDIGVTFTYNEITGDLHIGYDPNTQITGDVGAVIAYLQAPDGAQYYRVNHSGGNNIMGQHTDMANDQNNFTSAQALEIVPEDGIIEVMYYIPVREINAGPVQVYLQIGEGEAWPYAGGIFSIFWYEDAESAANTPKEPMRKEYVSDTMGAMCVTNRVEVVENEENIQEPVKEVTCVGGKHHKKGWRLVIRRYPHRGTKAHHYELMMENEYGVYQPLEGNMIFYMPYPNDYDEEKDSFSLRHYDSEYRNYELVSVEKTEFGVRFEVASLSPFVLDWGGYQDEQAPDQGGNGDGNGGSNNNRKYNVRNLRLNRGRTEVKGGSFRNVQITTEAEVQINGGWIENLSVEFAWDTNAAHKQTVVKGAAVEMLNLIISSRTPASAEEAAITFEKDAAVGTVFIVIFEGEEAPTGPIAGPLVVVEGERELPMLVIEGDYKLYDPTWIQGATFKEVQLPNQDPISYAEFLAMIGQ